MALGSGDNDVSQSANNQTSLGDNGYYDGYGQDAEKGTGQARRASRKMSRIDTKPDGLTEDDATDPSVSVGKQMELEAGNAIKYRTCSWRKV